ncbi:hypothetical protein BJV85_002868 [Clostridium acetobutylicum]|uniref:Phage major capsid protein n=1 Tax=Clostridium acetobutylicum (strain ATCC 824 / DSM 792 / JCM 1419 / IAM 19013 / LMG 5710 / NBRC 13948 / NRRL B-527 / VKM B-1787 / 2291 / W) TaxID=272562 RepID=Q97JZ2_CLOAB|nr:MULTISPECIES: hypothetical protein [Clostridium]AAK79103.1 Hypothetical protein CA_C1130 [Clostridium acetobutylicum ATCC 824]ADZ20179.1 Conserved hypothetical protein [Clostridium acetobutylicum EA 2018]AEI31640.1 hypothetical protein SMB_G1149 [Clostridium acetobutylicum DSM 1731]AWV81643.1 hypothetical protein DK921_16405 [Clostridium acetobutylicum]MBC2393289.1 hypothetical protein [Clostridium acetobutylicum]
MSERKVTRHGDAVRIFSAAAKGKLKNRVELENANRIMNKLAMNPTPQNRYMIAQIVQYSVENVVDEETQFLNLIADTKLDLEPNEKAEFKVKLRGVRAFYCAKGSTVERSTISHKNVLLDTEAVTAIPTISDIDMRSGRVNFQEVVQDAAIEMNNRMVTRVQSVLQKGISTLSNPNYATGTGLVKATLDAQIRAFQRLGMPVSLVGDIEVVSKLGELTGFVTANSNGVTQQFDPMLINEQNKNGFIGTYNNCNVIQLTNPFSSGSFSNTILDKSLLYIVPTGQNDKRSLKVAKEKAIPTIDDLHLEDRSYEMRMDAVFGAGLVFGDKCYIGAYKDLSIS